MSSNKCCYICLDVVKYDFIETKCKAFIHKKCYNTILKNLAPKNKLQCLLCKNNKCFVCVDSSSSDDASSDDTSSDDSSSDDSSSDDSSSSDYDSS